MSDFKKWAVFDMDDVLTDFAQSSYETMVRLGYPDIPVSEWKNYEINNIYGLKSHQEFIDMMINEDILSNSKIKEGVIETLQSFKDAGFHTGILTARGWHPYAKKLTDNFVEEHHLPIDKVVIAGHHTQGKLFYASEFFQEGEIVCYVDDSPKHIKDFKNAGLYSHLMRTSWIQDEEVVGLSQVHSIREYKDKVFKELGLTTNRRNKP